MKELPRLFCMTTDAICRAPDYLDRARTIADIGDQAAIVVRAPGSTTAELARFAEATIRAVAERRAPSAGSRAAAVVVHARPDLARVVGADGVQLRREDLSPVDARSVLGKGWIGVSIHDPAEAEQAIAGGADYLVAGNVFESTSHPGRPARELDWLAEIAGLGKPVIAIGGITPERAARARAAGAYGVAAISAIWDVASIRETAEAVRALLAPWAERRAPSAEPSSRPAVQPSELILTLNGESRRVAGPLTLADLLATLDLDPREVVVELNRQIVRRPALGGTRLRDGDTVELVHFVGGG
ncbi:MAG: sulfur carrier protein ThiS [Gemmatimonadales bacterium]